MSDSDSKHCGNSGKESSGKASWEQEGGAFKLNLEFNPDLLVTTLRYHLILAS